MSWMCTAIICPGLAPATRSGPVAGLTNGNFTFSAETFDSVEVMTPALQLISHSISTTSPGRISSTNGSFAESAYFRLPSLRISRAIASSSLEPSLQIVAPGQQQPLDMAHHGGQDEREHHGCRQVREHLRDHVQAAGLEDGVAQALVRGHELAHDRAHQREAHGEL